MVVFFDIDGTIVDEETQILPASAVRAVEQLGRSGHIAVVNTGRPFSHLDPRVRAMAFQGWVCGCGMEVRLGDTWLSRVRPNGPLCKKSIEAARRFRMAPLYEGEDGTILVDGECPHHPNGDRETERMRKKGFSTPVFRGDERPKFIKFVTFDTPGCDREGFLREMEGDYMCIDRGGTMIELVPGGCTKAGGMELLLKHLGVPREQVYAIGDSTNDLTMFAQAGHTACMGGGMAELKEKSDFVTAPVLEDGIEKALEHFGLL